MRPRESKIGTLVRTWLLLDFFGESRTAGQIGSTMTTTVFGQSFLALAFAAILYPETPAVPFLAATSSLTVLLVAVGALATANRTGRARADRWLLGTAPISRGQVLAAQILHGAFAICVQTIGLALPSAIMLMWLAPAWTAPAYLLLSCVLSGIAVGALALLLRTARWLFGDERAWLLAGTSRALLLAFGFVAFATGLTGLRGTLDGFFLGRSAVELLPNYWAVRWLIYPSEIRWLLLLAGLAVALLLLARILPEPGPRARRRLRGDTLAGIDRHFAGSGPLLGATTFTAAMLFRSPSFRGRVLPLFGLPAAMTWLAFQNAEGVGFAILLGMTLQFPAIYLPFLVAFLPRAEQEGAAWVFHTAPFDPVSVAREASLLVLTTRILVPIQLIAFAAMGLAGLNWLAAAALSTTALGAAVLVASLHVRRLEAMPFTEDLGDDIPLDFGGLLGSALPLALIGAGLGYQALLSPIPTAILGMILLIAVYVFLRRAPQRVRSDANAAATPT